MGLEVNMKTTGPRVVPVHSAKEHKLAPSYLFIGPENHIEDITKNFIKKIFCIDANAQTSCNACIDCKKVDHRIHHNLIWLEQENQYVTSDLEPIFQSAAFQLETNKHFFFVIGKAQLLNQFCANSLLKLMEEPPQGYHFILTAQTKERILPTILSRCIVQNYDIASQSDSIFFNYFNNLGNPDFDSFNKAVQSIKIAEADLMILIDQIYTFWMKKLEKLIEENDMDQIILVQNILDLMNKSRADNIMPGSGKIFLRNLYMRFIMLYKISSV